MLTSEEEWESAMFEAYNNMSLPESYRELLSKLWKAYCDISPNP